MATATFVSLVSGCGGESRPLSEAAPTTTATPSDLTAPTESTTAPAPTTTPSKKTRSGRVIKTADSAYGQMLFDRSGQAIYLFDREKTSMPECYGACADAWPPVLTRSMPQAAGAVRTELLGTTLRKDGSRQVTYDGHPLYFYAHEGKNEVLCHNVSEFGGLWLVVSPGGGPVA